MLYRRLCSALSIMSISSPHPSSRSLSSTLHDDQSHHSCRVLSTLNVTDAINRSSFIAFFAASCCAFTLSSQVCNCWAIYYRHISKPRSAPTFMNTDLLALRHEGLAILDELFLLVYGRTLHIFPLPKKCIQIRLRVPDVIVSTTPGSRMSMFLWTRWCDKINLRNYIMVHE